MVTRNKLNVLIEETQSGDKAAYNAYIDKKLKKYKVSSPEELDKLKKKKFFNEVDDGWESDDETEESLMLYDSLTEEEIEEQLLVEFGLTEEDLTIEEIEEQLLVEFGLTEENLTIEDIEEQLLIELGLTEESVRKAITKAGKPLVSALDKAGRKVRKHIKTVNANKKIARDKQKEAFKKTKIGKATKKLKDKVQSKLKKKFQSDDKE